MIKKTSYIKMISVVAIFCVAMVGVGNIIYADKMVKKQSKAPDFIVKDIVNKRFQFKKSIGKGPIILSFWATWCLPCIKELNELKTHYPEMKEQNVTVLYISVDDVKTRSHVRHYVRSRKVPYKDPSFQVLFDTNKEVLKRFQGEYIPYTVIVDLEGNIVYRHTGFQKGDVKKLLDICKRVNNVKDKDVKDKKTRDKKKANSDSTAKKYIVNG